MNHHVRGDARFSQRFRDGLVDAPMGLRGIKKSAGFGPADFFWVGSLFFRKDGLPIFIVINGFSIHY